MELLNALSTTRAQSLFYSRALYRASVVLIPTIHPRIFESPELFQHDPSAATIEVFHNGRRLTYSSTQSPLDGEFFVTETTTGAGYDRIYLVSFSTNSRSVMTANYFAKP